MPDAGARAETAPRRRPGLSAMPRFRPRFPWLTGDLQTLRNTVVHRGGRVPLPIEGPPGERLSFEMPDGTGDMLLATLDHPTEPRPGRPLVVLIHGLTGCEDSLYLRASAAALLGAGYPVLRLNLRGAGPSRAVCKFQYHAGRTEDLAAVLDRLWAGATPDGIVAVGYSLGGNMLLKLLGERGRRVPLRAAVSVSAPIDLRATQLRIMAPRNALYQHYILRRMIAEATGGAAAWTMQEKKRARAIRTVYAFDDSFVAPKNGFGTAERYYAQCSARQFLDSIEVPTLVIHARDDPWIPSGAYLSYDWARNARLTPLLPRGGGHVGFHDAAGPPAWHDRAILAWLEDRIGP
ncbi:MAG: alpha/beta fold hydrolase [Azospirillaceae bacterium]